MLICEGFYYVIVNLNMFITRCSYTDYATVLNSYNLWTQHCTDSKKQTNKLLGFLDTSVYVEAQQHQCELVYFKNKQTNKPHRGTLLGFRVVLPSYLKWSEYYRADCRRSAPSPLGSQQLSSAASSRGPVGNGRKIRWCLVSFCSCSLPPHRCEP